MDELLANLINEHFNSVKAPDLFKAYELLLNYNYTLHIEHFHDMLGTDATENTDVITTRILEIFEESLESVLMSLFIVPETTQFTPLYELLTYLYQLENYLDHQVILDEIEDNEYLNSPKETLIHLIEKLLNGDWAQLNENINEVRRSLITGLVAKHTTDIETTTDEGTENPLAVRAEPTKRFFKLHPDTIIAQFVAEGLLPVPVDPDKALETVTGTIYNLDDSNRIALELLALSFIAPVKLRSIPAQAKVLVNKLYVDVNTVTTLSIEIDKLVREGDLIREQQ